MKIALSILCENPARKTGLTTLFHELVTQARRLYPEVTWTVFAGSEQEWLADPPGVEVIRDYPGNNHVGPRLIADHFLVPRRAQALGADVLLTVGFVPLRKVLPTVMHMLSLQHLDRSNRVGGLRQRYRTWIAARGFRHADAIITNSQFARGQILSAYPECMRRLTVSCEGLQHDQFQPTSASGEESAVQKQFGVARGYLLWVSNFYSYKQADLLLAGYARLTATERASMPLVMVGGGWEGGAESAEGAARALAIREDVYFPGWIEDRWLAPLYRQAAIFVLPSREETFGRCVLEAMACGTPCLVNDIPIMHEVTAGHASIVDFRDASAVAAALRRLSMDEGCRSELRGGGLRRAADFSFEKLARERMEVIRRVAAAKPA